MSANYYVMRIRRCGIGQLIGIMVLLLLAGCSQFSTHKYVDEAKAKAEESQAAMRSMNSYESAKQSYLAGDLKQAYIHIKESISYKSDVADALLLRLQIETDMNLNGEVLKTAAAGTSIAPDDARFPYYTGIFYERIGQTSSALTCYTEAAAMDPASVQYKLATAETMIELKQFAGAEAYLKRAVRIHTNAPGLLQTLGALAQIQGDNSKAMRYFSEALALAPTARPIQENMAGACYAMKDYYKALQYLEPLIEDPALKDRHDLQSLAVKCYLACNRPVEARNLLRKLIKNPALATYQQLRQIADGALMLSDWPLLEKAARQMIMLDPNEEPGYLAMAVYFEKVGNRAAAWKVLEDYKQKSEGVVSTLLAKYQAELK